MLSQRPFVHVLRGTLLAAACSSSLFAQASGSQPTFEELKRHVLSRFSYGPTAEQLDDLQNMGDLTQWFTDQLNAPTTITGNERDWIRANLADEDEAFPGGGLWNLTQLQDKQLYLALNSDSQLREVMTYFWENLFSTHAPTIFGNKAQRFDDEEMVYKSVQISNRAASFLWIENNAYRTHALSTYHDVLLESFKNPAMRGYLNVTVMYFGAANEDYGRELLELHTLGPNNGLGQESYTSQDIDWMADLMTGFGTDWTTGAPIFNDQNHTPPPTNTEILKNPNNPDLQPFTVDNNNPGQQIPDLLAHLAQQTQTKKYICNRMIEFFVGERVALDSSLMVDCLAAWDVAPGGGNIKAILQAIVDSQEFEDAATGKPRVKTPFEYAISQARLFGGSVHGTAPDQDVSLNRIRSFMNSCGQPLFVHPSPDGYPVSSAEQVNTAAHFNRYQLASVLGSPFEDAAAEELSYDIRELVVNRIRAGSNLDINSATDVASAMIEFGLGSRHGTLEQNLCVQLLNRGAQGDISSSWSITLMDADDRLEVLCAYIAALPQSFEK